MSRLTMIAGIILIGASCRVVPHPHYVGPLTGIGLFAGAYLPEKKRAVALCLGSIFLSDIVLGFHKLTPIVYGSIVLTICIGSWLHSRLSPLMVLAAAITGSSVFFLVTNMGVWVLQGCGWGEEAVHPLTFEGLMAVYAAGLPYFYRAMIGDLLYTALFFGGFAIASRSVLIAQEPTHA